MLYTFAKILMTTGLRFFYRHICVNGLKNIPVKGPVIIIANHNSSLMDAALLGILLKRKAWFFARGDVFVNKFVKSLLQWFHMMPVHGYRGKQTLDANNDSFSDGQKILSKGGIIVFFPESTSHTEHQLLVFRKGVFRLAFDTAAANNFSFDIPIVPIGITYEHPVNSRTSVQVQAGAPLMLFDYKNEYYANAAAALLHICKDAHKAVCKLVLNIEDKNRLQIAGEYLTISRNDNPSLSSSWEIISNQNLLREQRICELINKLPENNLQEKKQSSSAYFALLSDAGLKDKTIADFFSFPDWKNIALIAGYPFYIAGLLLNALPILIARQIAEKKVFRNDFYSWIFVVCYSVAYFLWLIALIVFSFLFGWKYTVVLLLIMIATGLFAYTYNGWLKDSRQHNKWQVLTEIKKAKLKEMRQTLQQDLETVRL